MYNPFSWVKSITRIASWYGLALLAGWYFDAWLWSFALASTSLVIINYFHLIKLNNWLWHSKKFTPPDAAGIWGYIYDGIYYMQRRNRLKRKKLGNLIRRFREGSESLPDAAVVLDADWHIEWCNRLARIELGLNWPEDAERRIDNLIRHPDFVKFLRNGNYDNPIEIESPTNINRVLEFRMMPYGEKHYLLIARDITQISHVEQIRKDFVANVSHELRTPLTVLSGYLEMLKESPDMPESFIEKAFEEMGTQSVRMQSLVEQLLALSRIEASTERVYEKIVNVPQVLRTIEIEAQSLNKDKHHDIQFEIKDDLVIYGVETELRSAFSNLIFNAINYTPNGGVIRICWCRDGDKARFKVVDNGDGIAEEHLSRLTERFYRVDKARSRKTGGTGLGLSIVKHVLSHHNSRLEIKSEVGEGSEFSFSFSKQIIASV
ncbi:phosphate regulon sensor histidine kinase PhoR [Planctobacterium marinum]|uniref:phosphate regulon sensor histidine kinase PhoR n=1 Tax=Planctobacterium marinum TaxID=1631968 RepID=UPI001E44BA05|nr:phosphate regulon sensor histidine kinase PhoR [Planctobacterium marinum]MCC2604976.1 phosphate regulon sensor histidine kinase PhoR [Planctobacterium marinum]